MLSVPRLVTAALLSALITASALGQEVVEANIIHLDSKTMGQVAGPGTFFGGANGPYFILRGNEYSAIAGQRGLTIFSGGNVASPVGREGSVQFNTLDQIRMLITPSGNVGNGLGLNGIPTEKLESGRAPTPSARASRPRARSSPTSATPLTR